MCGFAALFEPGRRFPLALLAAMEQDLLHRGPDSGGRLAEPGAALVFRRLAILDPAPQSDQPMTDPTQRCTLVFNGEIYNYRALRAALTQAGVDLRTDGDTEAILHGYLAWGGPAPMLRHIVETELWLRQAESPPAGPTLWAAAP